MHHLKKLLSKVLLTPGEYLDIAESNFDLGIDIAKVFHFNKLYAVNGFSKSKPSPKEMMEFGIIEKGIIPYPDNKFTLITTLMVINRFQDFPNMISQITRVLKPGGYLFVREHDVHSKEVKTIDYILRFRSKYPDFNPEETIYFRSREQLTLEMGKYELKLIGYSDNPVSHPNPQKIYHALYQLEE